MVTGEVLPGWIADYRELGHQNSLTLLLRSDALGGFLGGPHGIWMDSQSDLYVAEVETTTDDFIEAFELYYMLQSYGGTVK